MAPPVTSQSTLNSHYLVQKLLRTANWCFSNCKGGCQHDGAIVTDGGMIANGVIFTDGQRF